MSKHQNYWAPAVGTSLLGMYVDVRQNQAARRREAQRIREREDRRLMAAQSKLARKESYLREINSRSHPQQPFSGSSAIVPYNMKGWNGYYKAARTGYNMAKGAVRIYNKYQRYERKRLRSLMGRGSHTLAHAKCVEWKFFDTTSTDAFTASTGLVRCLCATIATGNGQSNRVGAKIYCHKLDIKGTVTLVTDATNTLMNANVKVAVIWVRHTGGTAPTWLDVYKTASIDSLRNLDNTANIRVLWSRDLRVTNDQGTVASSTTSSATRRFQLHLPMKGDMIHYDDNAGAEANLDQGSIYMIAFCDQYASSDIYLGADTRLRYTD